MSHASLKLPRLKIHNPHIRHNILQTRHKLQMCRVFLQVIFPILFVLELTYECMSETAL